MSRDHLSIEYTSILADYRNYIKQSGIVPFIQYCHNNAINYRSVKNWMYHRNLKIKSIQDEVSEMHSKSDVPSKSFIPVAIPAILPQPEESYSLVTITRPDGIRLEVVGMSLSALKQILS
ncbi:MAG: hypothetical protein ACRDDZ_11300 [Marinifilaceae bacterium]